MSPAIAATATRSATPTSWWPRKHVSAMVHPFDVELGDDGRLYVSCQDTNTVVAILPKTRKPAPVAAHLRKTYPDGNFLPGTLVASSQGRLPEVGDHAPPNVPAPQGLKVVLDEHGKPRHSVRGIIVHRKHLYVADEAGDSVKIFEVAIGAARGAHQGQEADEARAPHPARRHALHRRRRHRQHSRLRHPRATAPRGKHKARVVIDGKLKAPSGFAIGADGDFYVAERLKQRVRRFSAKGKKKGTFIDRLPDMPEFLLHVPDRT